MSAAAAAAAIDVIAGDLSPTPGKLPRIPSSAPRQIPGATIFHDCLSQIVPKNPTALEITRMLRVFSPMSLNMARVELLFGQRAANSCARRRTKVDVRDVRVFLVAVCVPIKCRE